MGKGYIRAALVAIFAVTILPTITAQAIQSAAQYVKGE